MFTGFVGCWSIFRGLVFDCSAHSQRLQFAACGKFLEEHFVTPQIVREAIQSTTSSRSAACRLNVLRIYSSYVQTFGSLKEPEWPLLRELYPPNGSIAPKTDGGASRFMTAAEVRQFLGDLQEELESSGLSAARDEHQHQRLGSMSMERRLS